MIVRNDPSGTTRSVPLTLETSAAATARPVRSDMDPRLQRIVAMRRHGGRKAASASTAQDEVAVVAKVSDVEAWENLSEVRVGARVGPPETDGSVIVTGRIPISRVEQVRSQPFVRSLKAARPVVPALNRTVPEIAADPQHQPAGNLAKG